MRLPRMTTNISICIDIFVTAGNVPMSEHVISSSSELLRVSQVNKLHNFTFFNSRGK